MMAQRILMFGWEFPPFNSGGLGTACAGLAKSLSEKGHEIIFVLPKKLPIDVSYVRLRFAGLENMRAIGLSSGLYPYVGADGKSWKNEDGQYGFNLMQEVRSYAERAKFISQGENFDVIHAHDWLSFPAGIMAKEITGKPLVAHIHATEFDRTGFGNINPDVFSIEKEGMEKADRVVTVSNFTKNIVVDRYGIDPEKITVVHNGVDKIEEVSGITNELLYTLKSEGKKIVLFVGRITLQKGPDYFIKIAKRVVDVLPQTLFVMAGSGDMEKQVINEAAKLGISDKIIFTGFLRGDELKSIYLASDMYVLPSVSEPFGITPLEALSYGVPVLLSRQSGVSETLGHVLKADFWDIDDMADKIVSSLTHPTLHGNLKENGSREVKNITWSLAAEKMNSIYKNLCPITF